MEKKQNEITRQIIGFTLEIMHLLTGEDYTVEKKTCGTRVTPGRHPFASGGQSTTLSPIIEPLPLIHEQKILDLTHKMIELLTGEVPIRCQDVAVYFCMEEWEYIEGHKDLYEDVIMEASMSPDGSRRRNPPERCPCPLYSQDCPEEKLPENHQDENLIDIKVEVKDEAEEETDLWGDQQDGLIERNSPERFPRPLYSQDCPEEKLPENHQMRNQGEDLTDIKVEDEEERMMGDPPCKSEVEEDIPVHVTTGNPDKNSEETVMLSQVENGVIIPRSAQTQLITLIVYQRPVNRDQQCNPPNPEGPSPHQSQIATANTPQSRLVTREKNDTRERPFSCSICKKHFMSKSNLVNHNKIHTGEKPFPCSHCGKFFRDKSGLTVHERIHTGEKPYPCSECGKRFTNKSDLVKHMRYHTGEKPYPCSECGKCFISKGKLGEHQRIHTRAKSYSCSVCGKCFMEKSHLLQHDRTHTGEKPFSCSECGKCFISKGKLGEHQGIHTRVKSYSCLVCGKLFITKSQLVQHGTHTGRVPFSCCKCGRSFLHKSSLSTHQRSHTGEKWYPCSECGKCFVSNDILRDHERSHRRKKPS